MQTTYIVGQCLKKCLQMVKKWIKNVTEIDEKFIKNYDEDSDKGYILEVDLKYPRKLHDLYRDLTFCLKE